MTTSPLYLVADDAGRNVVSTLSVDDSPFNLDGYTVKALLTDTESGAVTEVTTVTVDPDQDTNTGKITTVFSNVATGTYVLEFEATDGVSVATFPSDGDARRKVVSRPNPNP